MSGLEVVGIVLGVLPLAVKALQGYVSVLSSMKNAQRNLNALIRDLETEQIRLQTTCELLLDGVAPPSVIDKLIQSPFGPDWKPYNDRLRLRLWTTSGKFEEQVTQLQQAAQELRAKLCLEADGSTKLADRQSISQELKRGTSFTLKRKDYDEILTRIKTANTVLHELAGHNCNLEPKRRHRSQARLIHLIRALARSIFNALLCSSPPCSCSKPHQICLELEPRDVVIVPTDVEDDIAKTFNFHMVMGSHQQSLSQSPLGEQHVRRWESIHLKLAGAHEGKSPSASTVSLPSLPLTASSFRRSPRGITWAKSLGSKLTRTSSSQSTSSSQTLTSVSSTQSNVSSIQTCTSVSSTQTLVEMTQALSLAPGPPGSCIQTTVSSLCQTIFTNTKSTVVDLYGYIADTERKFELRPPPQNPPDSRNIITLRALLGEKNATLPPFDYPQKLKVAVALSVSILHLFGTPWISSVVTLDDVLFFHDSAQPPDPNSNCTYQPFVIQELRAQAASQCNPRTKHCIPRPVNLAVLSLGALLIQVIVGRVVGTLDMTENMDMGDIASKHKAGTQLSSEVLENGGDKYDAVVKWCLGKALGVAGLDNEAFCQEFYGAVVAKLKEDAEITGGG
ncbi:hypothetical protein OQA88_10234 [Cercophora sp. LCS_1]